LRGAREYVGGREEEGGEGGEGRRREYILRPEEEI
jgi:hypothetical protein